MNATYICQFYAKHRGASGLSEPVQLEFSCEADRILPMIYNSYDHVSRLAVTCDGQPFELPEQRWLKGE